MAGRTMTVYVDWYYSYLWPLLIVKHNYFSINQPSPHTWNFNNANRTGQYEIEK